MSIKVNYLTRNHRFTIANYLLLQLIFIYWTSEFTKDFDFVNLYSLMVLGFTSLVTIFTIVKVMRVSLVLMMLTFFSLLGYFFIGGGQFSYGMSIFLLFWSSVFLYIVYIWKHELDEAYFCPKMTSLDISPPLYSIPGKMMFDEGRELDILVVNATLSGCFIVVKKNNFLDKKITLIIELNDEKYYATGTIVSESKFGNGISFVEKETKDQKDWSLLFRRFSELGYFY